MFFMSASPTYNAMPLPSLELAFVCAVFIMLAGEKTDGWVVFMRYML